MLKRDNYICQCCGFSNVRNDSGVYYLNVHHINSFCDNENLRFDVNNGVTLCVDCHKKLHGEYGNHTTINNYNEFILNHGKKIC